MSHRQQVFKCFKNLHNARKQVFKGDIESLEAVRKKINDEFRKNIDLTSEEQIKEKIQLGNDAAEYAKSAVVQAQWNDEKQRYVLKITKDTAMYDNSPYDGPTEKEYIRPKRRSKKDNKCPKS